MIEADEFAHFPEVIRSTERNPDLDSDAVSQLVGLPHSPVDQIIAFGRAAYDDVRRGADLQFLGMLKVILALHWLTLRIADGEDFGRAADQIGVKRSYAYALRKLYKYVPELRTWGETYRLEHGEYPSRHAMLSHCGIGLSEHEPRRGRPNRRDKWIARMQREIERLRVALSDSEARKAELRKKLAERDADVASLLAQLADTKEQARGDEPESCSRDSRGQPVDVRFPNGEFNYGGRTGLRSPDSGERTTPPEIFARFGSHCTFDVAANSQNALCSEYFTKEQDALKRQWPGGHIMWANPPYENLPQWCAKFVEYAERGGTVIALLPGWTDTAWFRDYCSLGEVTFVRKRLHFGGTKGPSPFASIIVEFTRESVRAGRQRREHGDNTLAGHLEGNAKATKAPPPPQVRQNWLSPPHLLRFVRHKFGEYWDACPYPLPPGFDALAMPRWEGRAYLNVPFRAEDELNGRGPIAWVRKAIELNRRDGTECIFVLPIFDYMSGLIEAGAEIIPLGRMAFLDTKTKEPSSNPSPSALFVLRGRSNGF